LCALFGIFCGDIANCVTLLWIQNPAPILPAPVRPRPGLVARGEVELEIVERAVPTPSRRTALPSPPFSSEVVNALV
jgi:hypothetical protein